MNNIVSIFEAQVRNFPDTTAVVCDGKNYSYSSLNTYANYIARMLLPRNVNSHSIIAITGDKSFELIAGILAILKLGCSYLPIDSSVPREQVQMMLENAKVSHLLCPIISLNKIKFNTDSIEVIKLEYGAFDNSNVYSNPNIRISADSPVYVMHTSGSTGIPKAVIVPHRALIRLLVDPNYIEILPTDSVLFHSNISFDAGIFELWAPLLNGAKMYISTHMVGDLPAIYKLCQDNEISVLLLATGLFHIFSGMNLKVLPKLRYLVVGGDVMHYSAAKKAIKDNKNLQIINGYGPAENTVFTTCYVISKDNDITDPVPIGKPINGTKVYLLDESLNEVKKGDTGEIYISGLGLAIGYLNAPELTNKRFLKLPHISGNDLLYRTGDLARELSSGNYEFLGRNDNQVKIRGFRVELTAIENVISSLEYVEDVCVCTIDDINKRIVVFVKININQISDYADCKAHIFCVLKKKLPDYYLPSYIEIVKTLPLTTNGKIDRKLLKTSCINI